MASEKGENWAYIPMVGYGALLISCIFAPRLSGLLPGIIAIAGLVFYILVDKKSIRSIGFSFALFLLPSGIFLLSALSFLWSLNPDAALDKIGKMIPAFLSGIILLHLAKNFPAKHHNTLYRIFIWGLITALTVLAIESIFRNPLYRLIMQIPAAETVKFSRLNQGTVILSLLLWPCLLAAFKLEKKYLPYLLFSAGLAIVLLTNSQSAQIALFIGGGAAVMTGFFSGLTLYALMAGTGLLLFSAPWLYRWLFEFWPAGRLPVKPSALDRLDVWYVFAKKIPENFFFGHGLEAAQKVPMIPENLPHFEGKNVLHPHSSLLQIWFETGLAGACIFYALIVFLLLRLLKLPDGPLKICATGCFASSFCISLFGYGVWQGWLIGLYFIAASMIICCLPHQSASAGQA